MDTLLAMQYDLEQIVNSVRHSSDGGNCIVGSSAGAIEETNLEKAVFNLRISNDKKFKSSRVDLYASAPDFKVNK